MIYKFEDSGVIDIIRNGWALAVYEDHLNPNQNAYIEKAIALLNKIKQKKEISKNTVYIVRSGKSYLRDYLENMCVNNDTLHSVRFSVDWSEGKLAGLTCMDMMLDHSEAALCLTNNSSKAEKAFLDKAKDRQMFIYQVYTGDIS